jgi:hypothetical protein
MNCNQHQNTIQRTPKGVVAAALATLGLFVSVSLTHTADAATKSTPTTKSAATVQQRAFAPPDALFQALAKAAKGNKSKTLVALLGQSGDALINSGDAVKDMDRAQRFAADYAEKHSIVMNGDAKAMLVVGKQDWPMPIPAVKGARGWTLDAAAGAREMLARRIGQNELDAIEVVRSIVDAERDYASEDRDADGLRNTRTSSSAGREADGLYWPTKPNEPTSPLGLLVDSPPRRIQGQTGNADALPRLLFQANDGARQGCAGWLALFSARSPHRRLCGHRLSGDLRNSGIMSFIVNQDGKVYQKHLGTDSIATARAVTTYHPDSSWTAVK